LHPLTLHPLTLLALLALLLVAPAHPTQIKPFISPVERVDMQYLVMGSNGYIMVW
jgi:hypothetical protein